MKNVKTRLYIPHHSYGNESKACERQEDETWKEVKGSLVNTVAYDTHYPVATRLNYAWANEYEGVLILSDQSSQLRSKYRHHDKEETSNADGYENERKTTIYR
jgi:hypothetical protein